PRAEGEECVLDVMCEPPLRCVDGACAALGADQAPCGSPAGCGLGLACRDGACAPPAPGPCATDADCGNLAVCATPRECTTRGGEGAACVNDDACADGLRCDAASSTCTAR